MVNREILNMKALLKGAIVAVSAAFAIVSGSAFGAESKAGIVPAKTAYFLSIPDVPALWTAWKNNALYQAYLKMMESPEMASKMEVINGQIKTIEDALGFPLNGETVSQVFKSADGYVMPGAKAGEATFGFVFSVADKQKLDKMIDLAEKAAASAAQNDDSVTEPESGKSNEQTSAPVEKQPVTPSGGADDSDAPTKTEIKKAPSETGETKTVVTATSTSAVSPVTSETYNGVTIKRFSGHEDAETYYATAGELFLVSNDHTEIKGLVDRAKSPGGADSLAALPEYKKDTAALAGHEGELFVFTSQKAAREMREARPGMEKLENLLQKMAPVDNSVVSVKIAPKEIASYSYSVLTGTSESKVLRNLFEKNPGDKPLEIVNYAPANALFVAGTSLLDAGLYYDFFSDIMGVFGSPTGMDVQIKGIEDQIGFSIKDDLIPALGNEAAISVNDIKLGLGGGPNVDAALFFRVANKEKMTKVLQGIDKLVATLVAANSPDATTHKSNSPEVLMGMKVITENGVTIKYMDIPNLPTVTPSYALDGDYLVVATTKDSIKNLLSIKSGKTEGLLGSDGYKQLGPRVTSTGNVFQMVNFQGVLKAATAALEMFPFGEGLKKYVEALKVLKTAGSSSQTKDGAIVSQGLLVLE